jgi:P-type E1-E2 ATPase
VYGAGFGALGKFEIGHVRAFVFVCARSFAIQGSMICATSAGFSSGNAWLAPSTVIGWAAGLERAADHEIARAIAAYARGLDIVAADVNDVQYHPNGITGRANDRRISIGSREFVCKETVRDADLAEQQTGDPASRVILEVDGKWAATFYFGDTIRKAVPALIETLKKTVGHLAIVSGDDETVTRKLAGTIGIDTARGNLLPAEKAAFIDTLTVKGRRPAMLGDGINDAAAMARAHLSVAVYNGQPLAAEAAHLTLMRGDPAQLPELFSLSRRINRKVTQNLWCAWIYNLVGIPVAMSGLLTPLVAAAAMLLSSLTVISNTLLLVRRNQ